VEEEAVAEEIAEAILAVVDEEEETAAAVVEGLAEEAEVEEEAEAEEEETVEEGLGLTAETANINAPRLYPARHTRQYRKGNTYMATGAYSLFDMPTHIYGFTQRLVE